MIWITWTDFSFPTLWWTFENCTSSKMRNYKITYLKTRLGRERWKKEYDLVVCLKRRYYFHLCLDINADANSRFYSKGLFTLKNRCHHHMWKFITFNLEWKSEKLAKPKHGDVSCCNQDVGTIKMIDNIVTKQKGRTSSIMGSAVTRLSLSRQRKDRHPDFPFRW